MKQTHIMHGGSHTRIYNIWRNMKSRCYSKFNNRYYTHGARGIILCKEWLDSFEVFREWSFANGYELNLSIDRKDNDKNYTPTNCRWVNNAIQQQNSQKLSTANKSGYRGVAKLKSGKFTASLRSFGKYYHLGLFDTPLAAAKTRDSYIICNKLEHTLNDIGCYNDI